jgi:hypothetical protein
MKANYKHLTKEEQAAVIYEFTNNLISMRILANIYGVSRQAIHATIVKAGIKPSKYAVLETDCFVCKKPVLRARSRMRTTSRSFCSDNCWWIYLDIKKESRKESSYFTRVSERVVLFNYPQYDPESGHVIHFRNNDITDSRKTNLVVLENIEDHLKVHLGLKVKPLWEEAST